MKRSHLQKCIPFECKWFSSFSILSCREIIQVTTNFPFFADQAFTTLIPSTQFMSMHIKGWSTTWKTSYLFLYSTSFCQVQLICVHLCVYIVYNLWSTMVYIYLQSVSDSVNIIGILRVPINTKAQLKGINHII